MEYEFYRDFHTIEYAERFALLLQEHNVPYRLEKGKTLLDAAIVGHGLVPPALIKIPSEQFKVVNEILRQSVLDDPAFVENHYLQQMDDKELITMVRNPTDWTVEDIAVARRILNDRGIPIPKEHIEAINLRINQELHKGKKAEPTTLLIYSMLILVGGLFLSPFLLLAGVMMGWYYWNDKTVDNQGYKYYTFERSTRNMGKAIFVLGWFALIVGAVLNFFPFL